MVPVPKAGKPKDKSLTPISIMVCKTIGLKQSRQLLKVLFDPGSTKMIISRAALPEDVHIIPLVQAYKVRTLSGLMKTADVVTLRELKFPKFDKKQKRR